MRFISFEKENGLFGSGLLIKDNLVVDMHEATDGQLPKSFLEFLDCNVALRTMAEDLTTLTAKSKGVYPLDRIKLIAPLP
ncbi:MAG: fumarylacetoacetate hydrolase family protein, partial [Bacillota bacterium]|nr:fumarylacetoacetate hydrolase family protein [Bacillota bacterium]